MNGKYDTTEHTKVVEEAISIAIHQSAKDLERITKNLTQHIIGFDCATLPEYQKAIKAIEDYKNAVINKLHNQS